MKLKRLHKDTRLRVCRELEERYELEGEHFFNKMSTHDQTWVHCYEHESKRQSMECNYTSSTIRKQLETQKSAGTVMLTVFRDAGGAVFCKYLTEQCIIIKQYYSDMLLHQVKQSMRERSIVDLQGEA